MKINVFANDSNPLLVARPCFVSTPDSTVREYAVRLIHVNSDCCKHTLIFPASLPLSKTLFSYFSPLPHYFPSSFRYLPHTHSFIKTFSNHRYIRLWRGRPTGHAGFLWGVAERGTKNYKRFHSLRSNFAFPIFAAYFNLLPPLLKLSHETSFYSNSFKDKKDQNKVYKEVVARSDIESRHYRCVFDLLCSPHLSYLSGCHTLL